MNERKKQTIRLILAVLAASIFLILNIGLKICLQEKVTVAFILSMPISMFLPSLSVKQLIANENEFMTQNGVPKYRKILNLGLIAILIFSFLLWNQNCLKLVSRSVPENEFLNLVSKFGGIVIATVVFVIMFIGYIVYSSKGILQQVIQKEKLANNKTEKKHFAKIKNCIEKVDYPILFYFRRQKIAWLLLFMGTSLFCFSLVVYIVFDVIVSRQSVVILFVSLVICSTFFACWLKSKPQYTFWQLIIAITTFLVVMSIILKVLSLGFYSCVMVVGTSLGCIASVGGVYFLNPIRK